MTCIKITAPKEDLEELRLLSEKAFEDGKIQARINLYHIVQASQEAIDGGLSPATFQAFFSGVSTIVLVVNLFISIQEKKKKLPDVDFDSSLRIKINTSNGRELNLTMSGRMTEEEIGSCQNSIRDLIDDFLSIEDGQNLRNLGTSEIAKINSLFKDLEDRLLDIIIPSSFVQKTDNKTVYSPYSPDFEKINLTEAIKIGVKETFYLRIDDVSHCDHIFYVLERENILSFHKDSTDIRIISVKNESIGFVGFTIEILPLFIKIKNNEKFDLFNRFR
jgi:hypothetical protein